MRGTSIALGLSAIARGVSTMVPTPTPVSVVDPRSICDRYSDDTYSKMEGDRERTDAYAAAITAAAKGRVCLDIGTGALALLALIAARAGAKHVYAIEANPEAAAAARSLVAAEGFANIVTIIEGYSTDVTLPERADLLLHEILGEVRRKPMHACMRAPALPRCPAFAREETAHPHHPPPFPTLPPSLRHSRPSQVAGAEGVVHALADAAARHWTPPSAPLEAQRHASGTVSAATAASFGGADGAEGMNAAVVGPYSIPARALSLIAPAEFPSGDYFASLPFPMIAAPGATNLKLPNLPRDLLLASPAVFEDLEFGTLAPEAEQQREMRFVASRDGDLRGLAIHIELYLTPTDGPPPRALARASGGEEALPQTDGSTGVEDGVPSTRESASNAHGAARRPADVSSARPGSHWPNVFLLLSGPIAVRAGDGIVVRTHAALGSERPRYTFEVHLAPGGGNSEDDERLLGSFAYP